MGAEASEQATWQGMQHAADAVLLQPAMASGMHPRSELPSPAAAAHHHGASPDVDAAPAVAEDWSMADPGMAEADGVGTHAAAACAVALHEAPFARRLWKVPPQVPPLVTQLLLARLAQQGMK